MDKAIDRVIKQVGQHGVELTRDEARQIIIETLGQAYTLEAFIRIVRRDILAVVVTCAVIYAIKKYNDKKKSKN